MHRTDEKLLETLKQYVIQGNCFTKEVQNVFIDYKNSGGRKETARQILEQLKRDHQNNDLIQDGVDDMLDLVTGWCSPHRKVWD